MQEGQWLPLNKASIGSHANELLGLIGRPSQDQSQTLTSAYRLSLAVPLEAIDDRRY
jgi:hypothetical protein